MIAGVMTALFGRLLGTGMVSTRPALPFLGSWQQRLRQALASSTSTSLAAAGLFAICYLLFAALQSLPGGKLHVHFLDVGRGEAILIETPDGKQVLPLTRHFVIDGGYGPTELLSALGEHMPFYDRSSWWC